VAGWGIVTQQTKVHQNRFPLFGAHAAVPCEVRGVSQERCSRGI
jgi:hypothetical protein